jgi:PKD repeat protein
MIFKSPGTYQISLTVTNTNNLSATTTKQITIAPDLKPVPNLDTINLYSGIPIITTTQRSKYGIRAIHQTVTPSFNEYGGLRMILTMTAAFQMKLLL